MERIVTYAEALREATEQEMARDDRVFVFGIGVDDFKGTYGTTKGLVERFGHDRTFDTPLSEDAMTGVAIGAAFAGLRPIHVHIRMDFLMLAMNQIVNIASKARYMYGGSVSVPIVVRSVIGKSWGQGAQHSQGLHAFFMHVPGLKVVAPVTPYDAKGTLAASIRDDDPVIFVEHRLLHQERGHVPPEPYATPLGKARVLAEGRDVTLVGVSYMAVECLRARHYLKQTGIEAEVIDPITLAPLDAEAIVASSRKTGAALVVDTGWTACGASAEILARVAESTLGEGLRLRRMGFAPVTCPPSKPLENLFYPDAIRIAREAAALLRGDSGKSWEPAPDASLAPVEFRGPF